MVQEKEILSLKLMKIIQPVHVQPLILIVFIVGLGVLRAQETTIQAETTQDMDTMLQAIEATVPVAATYATNGCNFYSVQHSPNSAEPWAATPRRRSGTSRLAAGRRHVSIG